MLFRAASALQRLKEFLPIVEAPNGTRFTYLESSGKKRLYTKLSANCFALFQ